MNTKAILAGAEKLHASAKRFDKLKVDGVVYLFAFNGSYVVTREDGQPIPFQGQSWTLNTRSIGEAKQWVREWLNS